jgi:UDP-3-O-acyl N-acetylglucosamine deacetylase
MNARKDPAGIMSDPTRGIAPRQRTIQETAALEGRGYLTGVDVKIVFCPAEPDTGVVFIRTDLPDQPEIPAHINFVIPRQRRTSIGIGDAVIEMIEHVMAALTGLGIDNCRVEMNAPETPGCDGSSRAFVDALNRAGIVEQDAPARIWKIDRALTVTEGGMTISAMPSPDSSFKLNYTLDYANHPAIGRQVHDFELHENSFEQELSAARTFVLESEAEQLKAAGIGRHCTTSDLLIFGEKGPIENSLRFENEPVRHKMLDVIGDLRLLGCRIEGQIIAHKSGHNLNAELVRAMLAALDKNDPTVAQTDTAPALIASKHA